MRRLILRQGGSIRNRALVWIPLALILGALPVPAQTEAVEPAQTLSPRDYLDLGNQYYQQQNWPEAAAEYRKALELRPDYVEAHYNLANTFAARSELKAALREYRETARLRPDFPGVHINIGVLLEVQGELQAAIEEYRTELRRKPDHSEALLHLGGVLADTGQIEEAHRDLPPCPCPNPAERGVAPAFGKDL